MFAEIINLKIKNMLIYNTTFRVDDEVHDNFLIWIKESYIPRSRETRCSPCSAHLSCVESS